MTATDTNRNQRLQQLADSPVRRLLWQYSLPAVAGMLAVLFLCVCVVNGARGFLDIAWQTYVLFAAMETFDIVVVDTLWVALSGWWDVPGIEDLQGSYKDWRTHMRVKAPRIYLGGIPFALVLGGLFWLAAHLL